MKLERSWDDGTKAYLYTGACCRMVFEYPVEKISLWLRDDKVVGIHIILEKFQKEYSESGKRTNWRADDFEKINGLFTALFGKPSSLSSDDLTASVTSMWIGNKISLVSTYEYLGLEKGDQQTIIIMSNALANNYLKDGF